MNALPNSYICCEDQMIEMCVKMTSKDKGIASLQLLLLFWDISKTLSND